MKKNEAPAVLPEWPVVKNIHQEVYKHASQPGALEMDSWHGHTACGTTHCRGGWVITLAGDAGRKLEEITGNAEFAAMMIYKASSEIRVNPARFYENAEKAMADMKRCAELEAAAAQ